MSIADHLVASFEMPQFVVESYLADLTDADLLLRPGKDLNHIAWQLGHLIQSEHGHVSRLSQSVSIDCSMPELPPDFTDLHTKETATSDDPERFLNRQTYLDEMHRQRTRTIDILRQLSDADLQTASPEVLRYFGRTVGCVFAGEIAHWMMHAGQWAVVRRKLGKPPLF